MPFSPGDWFVLIEQHSLYAPHVMKLPIRNVQNEGELPDALTVEAWDLSSRGLGEMIEDLVIELVPRFPATSAFDRWSVWKQLDPDDLPLFVGGDVIASIGTAATPGWSKATQETISMRDSGGNLVKVTLMDFASGDDFEAYTNAATIGVDGIVAQMESVGNGWSSRAGLKPSTFIRRTATLNEALRKQYRMG